MSLIICVMLSLLALCSAVFAQQSTLTCEEQLNVNKKTLVIVRDERDRWQGQVAEVWLRAEKAEQELARLKAELEKAKAPEEPKP